MIGTAIGIVVVALAAFMIVRGCIRFSKTGGQSACSACPFANHCREKERTHCSK